MEKARGGIISSRRAWYRMGCCLAALLAACLPAWAEPLVYDFSDSGTIDRVSASGRFTLRREEGHILLRGGSAVYSKIPAGPGTYRFRFSLLEPERFQYHRFGLVLLAEDPEAPDRGGIELMWNRNGIFRFWEHSEDEPRSMPFIQPGRDNPNRFDEGEPVDIVIHVPREGGGIYVYAHRGDRSGEPTTGFRVDRPPAPGYFGVRNTKWFSFVALEAFSFHPEPE